MKQLFLAVFRFLFRRRKAKFDAADLEYDSIGADGPTIIEEIHFSDGTVLRPADDDYSPYAEWLVAWDKDGHLKIRDGQKRTKADFKDPG